MTAEIAVMNKWAVALAADSKVTISGTASSKTYDTVNKVFTLSKVHPVGIMIYGNAEFMQYPWETIIKLYRRQKGIDGEAYVKNWGADFLAYLRKFGKIGVKHKEQNIKNILGGWFSDLENRAAAQAHHSNISVGSKAYTQLLTETINEKVAEIANEPPHLNEAQQKAVFTKYSKIIADRVHVFFSSYGDDDLTRAAIKLGIAALFYNSMSPQCSGIVIAGFGDKEFFPTVINYETDGYVGNTVKIIEKHTMDVARSNQSGISAFAQKEMVQRFMNGIDSDFMRALFNAFGTVLAQECLSVLEEYGTKAKKTEANRKKISEAAETTMRNFGSSVGDFARENFWMPVIRMVALLPKDELAHLAESLVALTSLKRRVSSEAETVGGPIDVALISKGDGFVWIKRKHYFPADLNHQFARNYLKNYSDEGNNHAKAVKSGASGGPAKAGPGGSAAKG